MVLNYRQQVLLFSQQGCCSILSSPGWLSNIELEKYLRKISGIRLFAIWNAASSRQGNSLLIGHSKAAKSYDHIHHTWGYLHVCR